MRSFLKRYLPVALLLALPACGSYTEWNDKPYPGVHDDTLGVHNESLYPDPAPITASAQQLRTEYEDAGPTAKYQHTAVSAPTQSNGGAGLSVMAAPRQDVSAAAAPAKPGKRGKRK